MDLVSTIIFLLHVWFVIDEDEDGDRITVCSDEELAAMLSYVSM